MLYCQRCKRIIDEDLVFCPKCREVLIEEHVEWQDFELEREVERAKHRSNMYIIVAIVLVTLGIVGGGLFVVSSSLLGLFGIALACLGIGCTAASYRRKHRGRSLKNQLSRCD